MQSLPHAQQQAVRLLYEDRQNDEAIARQCGVSRRTLARWKHLPDFAASSTALAAQSAHEWDVKWQQTLEARRQARREAIYQDGFVEGQFAEALAAKYETSGA